MQIDLNADLGESFGRWTLGDDDAMLEVVTSANVACGFHAGDPAGILRTLRAAAARGVQRTRVEHVAGGELRHGAYQLPTGRVTQVGQLASEGHPEAAYIRQSRRRRAH